MAITRVQTTGKTHVAGAGSASVSFGSPPTAGNLIVVEAWTYSETGTATGSQFTDNKSNSYSVAVQGIHVSGVLPLIAYLQNVPSSSGTFTITYTPATGTYVILNASEFSGIVTSNALDKTNGVQSVSAGTAPTVSTGTTNQADELIIAVSANVSGDNPATYTKDTNFTEEMIETDAFNYVAGEASYRIVSSVANYSSTWTTGSYDWSACIATFKAAAGGAAVTLPQLERGIRGLMRGVCVGVR